MRIKIVFVFIILNILFLELIHAETKSVKCAIVLHGLARTSNSMNTITKALKKAGYITLNQSYESTKKKIEELSPVISEAMDFCKQQNANEIYFVSHSMGGILVRHYFQNKQAENVKAVVMFSPPNHGSEIVDAFKNQSWFKWLNGPAGSQLGTEPTSLPNSLKPINLSVGVLTGNESSDPWFSYLFKGPNDGKVSMESAKLQEMKDFLVVPHGHTFIMNADDVVEQTLYFLKNNKFKQP